MASPHQDTITVRVDKQGRLVLPQDLRDGITTTPGEVLVRRTPDGILLSSSARPSAVEIATDGLPVLVLDQQVSNAEVLDGIAAERADR